MAKYYKDRSSRMRKFLDLDDEVKETRSKKASLERAEAMREGTLKDFVWASEKLTGRTMDDAKRRRELMRKHGIGPLVKEE